MRTAASAVKTVSNPQNPFESVCRELLEPPAQVRLQVYEDRTHEILSRNESPDLPFRWSLNPYRGCFHACAYCLHGETPILMADGRTRALADLKVGDEIYGTMQRDGDYRRYVRTQVLAHWSTVKPAYRILFEDGTELIASPDHRFLSRRGWKFVTGSEQGRTRRPHLTRGLKLMGMGRFIELPPVDAEYQKGYLTGLIRGDGLLGTYRYNGRRRATDVQYQFRLALVDMEALQRARQYLLEFNIPTLECAFAQSAVGRKPMRAIRSHSRANVERVRDLIAWPPAPSLPWSRGFLAGIFDAEGSYSRGILRIASADSALIDRAMTSLRHCGFGYALDGLEKRSVRYVRLLGGLREVLRFFHFVDPAINRKRMIEWQAVNSRAPLRVLAVQPLGLELPMYDITTGTGDFIANGVISHNCYARPSHEYWGFGAGTDFDSKIVVKPDAASLLRETFRKPSWRGELIVFSGNTDCYQPLEATYGLTRACLEVCAEFRNPVGIITKAALIVRDIALLKRLYEEAWLRVYFSVPFADNETARKVEPQAPSITKRLEAMKVLSDAGIRTAVSIAPVIPGLNEDDIPEILRCARESGASDATFILLRLPGNIEQVFLERMAAAFPDRIKKITNRIREVRGGKLSDSEFFKRHHGSGTYWQMIEQLFEASRRKVGFPDHADEPIPDTFRRPGPEQTSLF